MSDKYGRKPITIVGVAFSIVGALGNLISTDVRILYVMQFILGFSSAGRFGVGYVYMAEHWAIKDLSKATGIFLAIDALCLAFSSLYFEYISKNWIYLSIVPTSFVILFFISLFF